MRKPDSEAPNILIADDQPDVLEALRLLLKGEGYRTTTVTSPENVSKELEGDDFDLLLMDLNYADSGEVVFVFQHAAEAAADQAVVVDQ